MLAEVYQDRRVLQRLQRSVLGGALDELTSWWSKHGYSARVIQQYTRSLGHFAHWLERERLALASLDGSTARRFLDEHLPSCRCPVPTGESIQYVRPALGHLLFLLVGQGVPGGGLARPAPRVPALDAFEAYLQQTRGVAPSTCQSYLGHARAFVRAQYGDGPIDWARLTPADLTSYVTALAARVQPGTAKQGANALRSFLRCLLLSGLCSERLTKAVPSVSYRRLSQLPKVLSDEQLRGLLASFDRDAAVGRRGYAMALCLVRLGLRSCEVARLTLDDIDWQHATLRVTGKGLRVRCLPLPADLGRALVAYLRRGRPATVDRHVFVRHRVPVGKPLQSQGVRSAIRLAWKRVEGQVPSRGAHALRHTAATRLLRSGASLKQIADILGHRSLDTTRVYAKLDLARLAEVALPWPGAPA